MKFFILFLAILISFLWGLSPVIHKKLLKKYAPSTLFILTGTIYAFCMFFYFLTHRASLFRDISKMTGVDFAWLAGIAVIATFFANILYFYVLSKEKSYIISALIYSSPVFTLLLAYFFTQNTMDYYGVLGVFFIILGVICIAKTDTQKAAIEPYT